MKKFLLVSLKLVLTALVFSWVIFKLHNKTGGAGDFFAQIKSGQLEFISLGVNALWVHVKTASSMLLMGAVAAFLVAVVFAIQRWQLLLRIQGIHLSYYQVTWIWGVGMFFNAFLIGATGGDVFKAWYIAHAAPEHKPQAILSIAVDRLIGMVGLFLLAVLGVLINLPALLSHEKTRPLVFLIWISFFCMLGGIALTTRRHWLTQQPWWERLWNFMPAKGLFSKLSESYDVYGRYPKVLLQTVLLSLGIHTLVVTAALMVGGAIGIEGVGLKNYFSYCPLINAFASIPITVGGLGLREEAFRFFFSLNDVPDAKSVALSILFYSVTLIISLGCGIFYLLGKPKSFSSLPAR